MLACGKCQAQNDRSARFCEECGHSLAQERQVEQEADRAELGLIMDEARKAAHALWLVAALEGIGALVAMGSSGEDAIAGGLVAVFFAALAIWARRAPYVAGLTGVVLWVILHIAAMVMDPTMIYKGILLKAIVIAMFVRGIKGGAKAKQFAAERGL